MKVVIFTTMHRLIKTNKESFSSLFLGTDTLLVSTQTTLNYFLKQALIYIPFVNKREEEQRRVGGGTTSPQAEPWIEL